MKFNIFVATSIAVILTAWIVLGSACARQAEANEPVVEKSEKPLPSVRTRDSVAEPFAAELTLRGKTEASRTSVLKAETAGPILDIVAQRGSRISKGDVILRINPQSLPEQLAATEALVKQRELEHAAAQKLQSSGYQSETRLVEANALLAQARNQLSATRIALANTTIRAPYDGVFNERLVEVGEFVSSGDPVAQFLELDPMIVTAEATELEVQKIKTGAKATAKIGTRTVEGIIRYISLSADQAVRTYTVEFAFDNSSNEFQAGLTADIIFPTEAQFAHKVTPALLFLSSNTDGDLGIKSVDENDIVSFHTVEIIGSASDGVWIGGLPESIRIITVGQGFVKPGIKVKAVDESTIN